MSAKATAGDAVQNREITCADDARTLEEGDRVRVTYESTYGDDSEKTFTATVDRSAISDVGLGRVYLHSDVKHDRRPCYEGDGPERHLQFLMDDIELKMKNGGRWQRLSDIANDPTVEVIKEAMVKA